MLVCNNPPLCASISLLPLCQCVCCCEWDLVSHTESQGFLKHVLTHPCPSPTALHMCVCVCECVCMSGRLIQPCHRKPYHCWTGFNTPPQCQLNTQACTHTHTQTHEQTLKIPWLISWHLINVSLKVKVMTNTNKLYLVACQTCLCVSVYSISTKKMNA